MRIAFLWCMVCLCGIAAAGQFLFERGKSAYVINVPDSNQKPLVFAAEELQKILKKSGGAVLPVVLGKSSASRRIILAVENPADKEFPWECKDRVSVRLAGTDLVLSGNRPRCVLYAVYRFAERQLGFRWIYPGDEGEFYPRLDAFELSGKVNEVFVPGFASREMSLCTRYTIPDSELWAVRNYMNNGVRDRRLLDQTGVIRIELGHHVSLTKEMFASHPEYFSLLDGRRSPRGLAGCWSNPGFLDYVVKKLNRMVEERHWDLLCVFPADIRERCQCAECTREKDASARWYKFYEKIQAGVRSSYPRIQFVGSAYHEYQPAPGCDVSGLAYVQYCLNDRCHIHPMDHPDCPYNRKCLESIRRWRQKKVPLGFYGYESAIFREQSYLPDINVLSDQCRYFYKTGMIYAKTEFPQDHWTVKDHEMGPIQMFRLRNYVFATLCHSPMEDVGEILQRYCRALYGPAWEEMFRYHSQMAAAWDSMKIHLTFHSNDVMPVARHLLNPVLIGNCRKLFAQARAKLSAGQDLRYQRELRVEQRHFDRWREFYEAGQLGHQILQLPSGGPEAAIPVRLVNRKGTGMKTRCRIARDDRNLYFDLRGYGDTARMAKGSSGRDVNLWKDEHAEVFIQTDRQTDYFHFAVNAAGGTYDARMLDAGFDCSWQSPVKVFPEYWEVRMTIPFASLGITASPEGGKWLVVVTRESQKDSAGYPDCIYHHMDAAAQLIFNRKADSAKMITMVLAPESPVNNLIPELVKDGWNVNKEDFSAPDSDWKGSREIILLNHMGFKKSPEKYYRTRLIPALNRGAAVIFDDSGFTPYHAVFRDDALKTDRLKGKSLDAERKVFWQWTPDQSVKPDSVCTMYRSSPYFAYRPVHDGWRTVLYQKTADGKKLPVIMVRPWQKGTVVAWGEVGYMQKNSFAEMLENVLRFTENRK